MHLSITVCYFLHQNLEVQWSLSSLVCFYETFLKYLIFNCCYGVRQVPYWGCRMHMESCPFVLDLDSPTVVCGTLLSYCIQSSPHYFAGSSIFVTCSISSMKLLKQITYFIVLLYSRLSCFSKTNIQTFCPPFVLIFSSWDWALTCVKSLSSESISLIK